MAVMLVLDVGNTRIKWAWRTGDGLRPAGAETHHGRSADDLVTLIGGAPAPPVAIRVASVATPERTRALGIALAVRFAVPPLLARTAAAAPGLRNGYQEPGQLGVDRWLALRAVSASDARAACVVAAGTACTIDLLAPDGQHRGGLIVPGLALMATTLHEGTDNLARLAAADPPGADASGDVPPLVARATGAAIRSGALWALAALIRHHHGVLQAQFPDARLVLTGGDAPRLLPLLAGASLRPDLVLEGLCQDPCPGTLLDP